MLILRRHTEADINAPDTSVVFGSSLTHFQLKTCKRQHLLCISNKSLQTPEMFEGVETQIVKSKDTFLDNMGQIVPKTKINFEAC